MNYEHAYHAGNHADLLKHTLMSAVVSRMAAKPKPLVLIDLFAGSGLYDLLLDDRAQRGGEWRSAAAPIWARRGEAPRAMDPFLSVWRAMQDAAAGDTLRFYPGSPALAARLTRSDDKVLCVEAKATEAAALEKVVASDGRVRVYTTDGWTAAESFLPPSPRRGVLLVDPPFEKPGEFERMAAVARRLRRAWEIGVGLFWWPEKSDEGARFDRRLGDVAAPRPVLRARLRVSLESGLRASSFGVVNPPYGFDQDAREIVAFIAKVLSADVAPSQGSVDWINPAA